jgi:phage gpG-like protein
MTATATVIHQVIGEPFVQGASPYVNHPEHRQWDEYRTVRDGDAVTCYTRWASRWGAEYARGDWTVCPADSAYAILHATR